MTTGILVFVMLMAILIGYALYTIKKYRNMPEVAESDKILEITDTNLKQQLKHRVVLIDFWASWCLPCKMTAPVLNEIAEEIGEKARIGKVNIEKYQSLAMQFNIRNIPTLLLFKDGKEINRFVGVKSRDFLLKQINQVL